MSSVRNELALANAQELINVRVLIFSHSRASSCRGKKKHNNVAVHTLTHRKQTTNAMQNV